MNQYRNIKLPDSFLNMFTDVICTDDIQTRHNDYNLSNKATHNKGLFKYLGIIFGPFLDCPPPPYDQV